MDNNPGATDDDLLLAACRNDQDEMLEDVLKEGDVDINHADGLGDTALHYCSRFGSLTCLEMIVDIPNVNVNLRNKQGNTPLHLAVQYEEDPEVAVSMVDILLDSGADPRIRNKANSTVADFVVGRNDDMRALIDQALAGYEMEDTDEE
ncbi:ankyrin repeat-containing domain protein [Thamnidium elegans]|nr:ankyrin repeat-containing domain protein [Thamnidium elegans]